MPQLSAVKNATVGTNLRVAGQSIQACGGDTHYNGHELSRLYRDILAGLFQPSDQEPLYGTWTKMVLGLVIE